MWLENHQGSVWMAVKSSLNSMPMRCANIYKLRWERAGKDQGQGTVHKAKERSQENCVPEDMYGVKSNLLCQRLQKNDVKWALEVTLGLTTWMLT